MLSTGLVSAKSACPKNPCFIPKVPGFVVASRASLRRGSRSRDRIIQSVSLGHFSPRGCETRSNEDRSMLLGPTVPAPARFLRRGSASLSGAIGRGLVRSFHLPHRHRTARPRLPKSNMAAAAAASCYSATALQAPSAAAPGRRRRGVVGYGCSSAHSWAHRPPPATPRIRRPPPRRAAAAARVSCAYSGGAERITACSWNECVICSDVPVLVEFWASWCGPCRMVTRLVDEIAQEYVGKIKCYRLDTDDYPQTATSYDIDRIPTVLLFKDGEKVQSITGTLPKAVYVRAIEKFISEQ